LPQLAPPRPGPAPPPEPPLSPGYGLSIYRGHPACWLSAVAGHVTNSGSLVAYGAKVSSNLFHHVALTVERHSTSGVRLYLDGRLVLSSSAIPFSGTFSN